MSNSISVILPVFNGASFIKQTLRSVAGQTIAPLEIIVIDDGSTDQTLVAVSDFSNEWPNLNVRVISKVRGGAGSARNMGLTVANGDWIAFLDSDDLWLPTKIAEVFNSIKKEPRANFFAHNEFHQNASGKMTKVALSNTFDPSLPLIDQLFRRNIFSTSSIVAKKALFEIEGGFDEDLPIAQDYEMWLRIATYLRVSYLELFLGVYKQRVGNITSSNALKRLWYVFMALFKNKEKVSFHVFLNAILLLLFYFTLQGFRRFYSKLMHFQKGFET